MSAPYLISKSLDPVFALFIGTSAAWLRVRREEREIHGRPDSSNADTWRLLTKRVKGFWGREVRGEV